MSAKAKWGSVLRGILWVALAVLGATAYAVKLNTPLVEQFGSHLPGAQHTVFTGSIEPGIQTTLLSDYSANVVSVHVKVGDVVHAGDPIAVLASPELNGQVAAAQRRLDAASAHLATQRSQNERKLESKLQEERLRTANRGVELAKKRLKSFKIEDSDRALAAARKRLEQVRTLVQRGLATDSELENEQSRERSAVQELDLARDRQSRLEQELEQAESQLRLTELSAVEPTAPSGNAEADYADALAALTVAQDRVQRLSVTAPHDGTVVELPVQPGDVIPSGARLARIADLSRITVVTPVSAAVAQHVAPGRSVKIKLPLEPAQTILTQVTEVGLVPEAGQQSYLIKVTFPNPAPNTVLVGLAAEVEIDHGRAR